MKSNTDGDTASRRYWSASLRITLCVLVLWFVLSLVGPVIFREWLDRTLPAVGGAPFGFWMAQQGSIIGFVLLLVLHMLLMNRLDKQQGYSEEQN
ncbi:MAG: DUF4212 domain-containing protein [Pirellulaceae bacterium]